MNFWVLEFFDTENLKNGKYNRKLLRVGILDDFHRVEHTVLPEFLLKVLLLDSGAKIGHVQYVPIGL